MKVRVMAQDAVQFNMLKHYKVSARRDEECESTLNESESKRDAKHV